MFIEAELRRITEAEEERREADRKLRAVLKRVGLSG